ncbi:hypothetical protein [Aequorivita xiaoshiensis]|uniref:Uncharacterized protein n=1 Tax=Aequorivita xiaoshiensis TaxID=2874476 RepID=A0A9X1U711_9FLAO|nr:hypothetical protein [Aequorivita xiaoshiensis]MCG2432178.1 hypothetical protein [Aequorivita xiaoshiensis]
MRLRIIRDIIDEEIPFIELKGTARNSNPKTYQLTNADTLQNAISELDELGMFDTIIEQLKKQSFYSHTSSNNLVIPDQEYRLLAQKIPELKRIAEGISRAITQTIDDNDENVISIKIPKPQNFEDLKITSDKLHKVFSQTLSAEEINGGIRIKNFDTGSYWVDIIASSKEVVAIIAGLAWSGVVVFKKLQEGRVMQQQARELKISNDAIEEIVEKTKEKTNEIADMEANHLYKMFFKGKNNEQIERIKMALKELADLYSKGAELHPSLNAENKIIEAFPDFERIESIMSKIKKIEGKK